MKMQKNYTLKAGLKQKIVIWSLVGLAGLVSAFNTGCLEVSVEELEKRYDENRRAKKEEVSLLEKRYDENRQVNLSQQSSQGDYNQDSNEAVMDGIKEGVGTNLATQGILEVLSEK